MKVADYVVTESGFGADLGAEKVHRHQMQAVGAVARTRRSSWLHSGRSSITAASTSSRNREDVAALEKGLVNLERHVDNVQNVYGIPCVDVDQSLQLRHAGRNRASAIQDEKIGGPRGARDPLGRRRQGAAELAKMVVALGEKRTSFPTCTTTTIRSGTR